MVRLLSLMILLLVPNPFKPQVATDAVPEAQLPPAIVRPAHVESDRAQPVRLREARRVSLPAAVPGEPAPPDSTLLIADPREHPTV